MTLLSTENEVFKTHQKQKTCRESVSWEASENPMSYLILLNSQSVKNDWTEAPVLSIKGTNEQRLTREE